MIPVILESPFSSKNGYSVWDNIRYARMAMNDCLLRGEAPFASHLLYTQPGVLNDEEPLERELGIKAGFIWRQFARYTVFYTDLGISAGMNQAYEDIQKSGGAFENRKLHKWVI